MRSPLKPSRNPALALFAVGLLAGGPVLAGPPTPPKPAVSAPAAIPDYGGRDSAPLAVADNAPNPAAQAGRALEALVLVLAGIVGLVYVLKRYGLVSGGADGKPARITLAGGLGRMALPSSAAASPVTVVSSQSLPGGAMLHVVTVSGRTLLLAATAQSVTSVAEWPAEAEATPRNADEASAFEDYLARADAASPLGAANARLRSLLSRPQPGDAP